MQYVLVKSQDLLKKQEASGILINLDLNTLLSKIPLLGDNFF